MPRVYTEPFQFHTWQGQRIGCGPLKIVFVPALGGRIVSLRFEGKEFLFADKDVTFPLVGGDKTWVAPQIDWPDGKPFTDLDAGEYALTWYGTTAVLTSPVCKDTGLKIVRKINIEEDLTLKLVEEFHNATSDKTIRKGIWNVTQLKRPCTFFIPANKGVFRSYHHEDKTLPSVKDMFKEADGWVEIACRDKLLFKCGGIPKDGQVLIKMPLGGPKELVWLKTFQIDPQAEYAHRSAVEVFNSDQMDYAEVELHAPLVDLKPGETTVLAQEWRFKKI